MNSNDINDLAVQSDVPICEVRESRKQRSVPLPRASDRDEEVIAMVEHGDIRAALSSVMARHGVAIYRYCYQALRDAALADDVHQQVFIEAYRALPRFTGRSTVRTWLFAIARHRVLDAARARARAYARVELDNFADAPDQVPQPGELLDDRRLCELVAKCFAAFDEKVRTALLLRYQQGFTFEEMAAICGENPGTLHRRVARALPILQMRLRRAYGGPGSGRSAAT